MKHWFLPETPDLLGALNAQIAVTGEGLRAFLAWARGDEAAGRAVSDHEHLADDAKRAVLAGLRVAFSTPLDPEDIYSLAERIDAVMNASKNIVREAEVMAVRPDAHMAAMAEQLSLGLFDLVIAIGALVTDDQLATDASDAAVRRCRDMERLYRVAMSELLDNPDLGEVMGRRELYRRFSRAAEAIEAVSERVWYSVVKSA